MKTGIGWPPTAWLALAIACFAAAAMSWQARRLDQLRPPTPGPVGPAVTAPEPAVTAPALTAPTSPTTTRAQAAAGPDGWTPSAPGSAPPRASTPLAGRQVLRCVVKGQITYKDLNAGCPQGAGQPVTVFPTEGVQAPR